MRLQILFLFPIIFIVLMVVHIFAQDLPSREDRGVGSENPIRFNENELVRLQRRDGLSVGMFQKGKASYYADKFHGRRTASGERFDMYAMTAAHKTLPFGTIVLITNLLNGKNVPVRINDRGPFIEGRIIDISKRAAEYLSMINIGVIPTEIIIQSLPNERILNTKNQTKAMGKRLYWESDAARAEIPNQRRLAIQIASYAKQKYAHQQRNRLENAGIPVHFEQYGSYQRLIIVNLNEKQVEYYRAKLARLGLPDVLVRQE